MIRSFVSRLAAVVFGIMLFWASGEAAARIIFSQVVRYDIEMWKYTRQLKVEGEEGSLRFENVPDRSVRLMGVEVTTNSAGMRDREYTLSPAPHTTRIAVLGDSITFGWGVEQGHAYPDVLETLLKEKRPLGAERSFEVLNFGVGNYNTEDEYRLLLGKALKYNPDLILVGMFVNDAEESRPAAKPFLLHHSVFAVWVWGRIDGLLRSLGAREDYRAYYRSLYGEDRPGFRAMKASLAGIFRVGREREMPVVIVMLPELHEPGASYPFHDIHEMIGRLVEGEGGVFVDPRPALDAPDPVAYWVSSDDAHPNAGAHAVYAGAILRAVPWRDLLTGEVR